MINHITMRPFFLALILAACSASRATLAPQDLYIADPGTGAIYVVPTDTTNATPQLLSARTTIFTDKLVHLGTSEIAFVPDGHARRVTLGDFGGNSLHNIVDLDASDFIVAIGNAPTQDEISLLALRTGGATGQCVILDATRGAAGSPWAVTERAAFEMESSQIGPAAILKLAEGVYAALLPRTPASGELRFLDYRGETAVDNLLLTTPYDAFLERGPGGDWLCLTDGGVANFFDLEGNPSTPPEAASSLLTSAAGSIVASRSPDSPQLAVISRGDLRTSDPPYGVGETPVTRYSSRAEDEVATSPIVPEKDITGARTLQREAGSRWLTHDPTLEGLFHIDTVAGTRSKEFFLEVGSGPAFGHILDMTQDPTGRLFVLDEVVGACRIVEVDTKTGTRKVLVTGLGGALLPKLFAVADGEFRVAEHRLFTYPVGSSPPSEVKLALWRIIPGQDPTVYTKEQLASVVAEIAPFDCAMTGTGDFRALFPTGADRFIMRRDGTGFVPELPLAIPATGITIETVTQPTPTYDVVGTLQIPADVAALDTWRLRLLCGIRGLDRGISPVTYELGPLGGETYTGPLDIYHFENTSLGTTARSSNLLESPSSGLASGSVPVRVKLPCCFGYQNLAQSQITLVAAITKRPRFLWSLDDGTQLIYEVLPPALLKVTASPLAMQRTDIVDELGGEAPGDLSHPADFIVDEAAGLAFVSNANPHRLYRIDLATGASVLLSEGKPALLQEDKTGTPGDYAPQLVLGPRVERTALTGGWILK